MELKRILAKDLRAATEKAVSLYGAEALVVSHEQVNGQTEVIVAVDLEPKFDPYAALSEEAPEIVRSKSAAPGAARVFSPEDLQPEAFKPMTPKVHPPQGFDAAFGQALGRGGSPSAPQRDSETGSATGAGAAADDRDRLRAREIVDLVRQEMAVLRREIRLQQRLGPWGQVGLTPLGQQMDGLLEGLGAPTAMRALLVEEVQQEASVDAALKKAEDILKAGLSSPQIAGPLTGVHVILGPSGAGKTQTVARLAHQAAEAWGSEQVAVISWSDSRLGAWAQIQMACAKLGVDCFRVHDAALLTQMRQELGDRQCVIIDTPGVALASHAERLCSQLPSAQFHLVLPADTTAAHAGRLLALRSWASLVVTKVDEACQSWGLIQALGQHPVPFYALAANGPGPQSGTPMNASVLARLAIGQLRDQFAQDTQAMTEFDDASAATMGEPFRPTQARLAPKAER
ncbi:MAG: AAA family ATPase [Burkholderiaceae bacterium]